MQTLTRARLEQILEACRSVRVGVIGDFTLDAYWYADMTRSQLSREAPLYPRPVFRETYSPGGPANVAWNAAALGVAQVLAFTVLGQDWRGGLLADLLKENGISLAPALFHPGWKTPLYGKVILTAFDLQQEDSRLDFVNPAPLPPTLADELLARLEAALPSLDALIVADYQPAGLFSDRTRLALNHLAAAHPGVHFVVDSRDAIGGFQHMALKPNETEAARYLFPGQAPESVTPQALVEAALQWQRQVRRPIVITQGAHGCLLVDGQVTHLPAVRVPPPIDPVGAGDTFLAALAAGLASGAWPWEACTLANLAAAVTIRQLRVTGTASPAQILQQFDAATAVGAAPQPEAAQDGEQSATGDLSPR